MSDWVVTTGVSWFFSVTVIVVPVCDIRYVLSSFVTSFVSSFPSISNPMIPIS